MVDSAGKEASGAADAAENQSGYLSSSQTVVMCGESRAGTLYLCLPMKSLDLPMS